MGIIKKLLRLDSDQQEGTWITADAQLTSRILGYAGRTTDKIQLREAIVRRYGTRIRRVKDAETGIEYETYINGAFNARVEAGQVEAVSVGYGHKLASALATMFSSSSQNFDLVAPDGADTSEASKLLGEIRGGDQFIEALTQADIKAVWVGCIVVFMEFVDGKIRYRSVSPGKVNAMFESSIESNGKLRAVNYSDIEDATCVIIETGSIDDQTRTYTAIFGRSKRYPNGRYVSYQDDGDGTDVPDPNPNKPIFDWTDNGEIANPLSSYANEHPDITCPEYPVAILYSGLVECDKLFPVSDWLRDESIENDIAASKVRSASTENARGTRVLSKTEDSPKQPIPPSLYGEVTLEGGQKLEVLKTDSLAPKIAWDLLLEEMTSSAQGSSVPDYFVNSRDHTVEAASGVALKVRAAPLTGFRKRRTDMNAPSVKKMFEVERAFASLFADADADENVIRLLESCEQNWDPGEQDLPEDETQLIEAVLRLVESGLYDTIEAIRVVYALTTEKEAIEKYMQLKKRGKMYPPLNRDDNKDEADGATSNNDRQQGEPDDKEKE